MRIAIGKEVSREISKKKMPYVFNKTCIVTTYPPSYHRYREGYEAALLNRDTGLLGIFTNNEK